MLEIIHIDVTRGEADVRCDPVAELHQFDFQALFVSFFDGGLQRNGEGGSGADFQRGVGGEQRRAEKAEGQGQYVDWQDKEVLGHVGCSSHCLIESCAFVAVA